MLMRNHEIRIISEVLGVYWWLQRTAGLCLPRGNGVVAIRNNPPPPSQVLKLTNFDKI